MIDSSRNCWQQKQTDETNSVEKLLTDAGFEQVDAYRYNSASIRLRVIDPRFERLSIDDRDEMVDPLLKQLPDATQADIMTVFLFAPSEVKDLEHHLREGLLNLEFMDPSPSLL